MEIQNILAFRNDRFGEFLLNIPAFRAIKKRYPQASLTLVVNSNLEELARCIDGVDKVLTWEPAKHKWPAVLAFSRQLKECAFDISIAFNSSKEINIISFLAGIPIRLGYNRKWGFLLTRKISDKKYLGDRHEIDCNLELAGLAGAKSSDKTLSLNIGDAALRQIENDFGIKKTDAWIAVHPWTSDPIKQWPLPNFSELSRRLSLEFKVVIIGGKGEAEKSKGVFADLGAAVLNLTGRTSLKQLAALLSRSRMLISGDSGPVHLASCVGLPVVAIFRNDMPEKGPLRWGPSSSGSRVIEKENLTDITVDEVLLMVLEALKI